MIRRFEFIGGTFAKFWEVSTAGNDVTVRYGRLGSTGHGQDKSFASPQAAQNHAEKLVGEKLGKGYREVAVC